MHEEYKTAVVRLKVKKIQRIAEVFLKYPHMEKIVGNIWRD